MEEVVFRGTVRREIAEDKENEGEGERPPSREEGRKC